MAVRWPFEQEPVNRLHLSAPTPEELVAAISFPDGVMAGTTFYDGGSFPSVLIALNGEVTVQQAGPWIKS